MHSNPFEPKGLTGLQTAVNAHTVFPLLDLCFCVFETCHKKGISLDLMIWLHKFKAEGCLDAETAGYRQMHRQNAVHKPQVFNLYKYKIINKKKVNFMQKSEQMSQRPLILCEHSQRLEHKEKVDTTVVIWLLSRTGLLGLVEPSQKSQICSMSLLHNPSTQSSLNLTSIILQTVLSN